MPPWTLSLGFLIPYVSGGTLIGIGEMLRRRAIGTQARNALLGFAAFWYGFGATMVCYGTFSLLVFVGIRDLAVHLTILHLLALPLSIALAGLVYYLLFLYTGKRGWFFPVAILYSLFFVFNQYRFASASDPHLLITPWQAGAVGGGAAGGPIFQLFIAILTLPALFAVVAYASLLFKAKQREQRFRIAVVSGAFFVWFATYLIGFTTSDPTAGWKPLFYQGMGLPVGLAVLFAFRPPAKVRRWLGTAPRKEAPA